MSARHQFVAGDTGSKLRVTCIDDATGLPIDLTGATVTLRWRNSAATNTLEKTMTKVAPETGGIAEYQFATGELYAKEMRFEVKIVDAGGKELNALDLLVEKIREPLADPV